MNRWSGEQDYSRVIAWEEWPDFNDEESGIGPGRAGEDALTIRGRVQQIVPAPDGDRIIDIHPQSGPAFFSVSSHDIDDQVPAVGTGFQVMVEGALLLLHKYVN